MLIHRYQKYIFDDKKNWLAPNFSTELSGQEYCEQSGDEAAVET